MSWTWPTPIPTLHVTLYHTNHRLSLDNSLATPRDNLTTIFNSHNDPQSRRWGTSYVRRWGTHPSSLTSNALRSTGWGTSPGQGTLSVYPLDYSRLHGPLPIPTCFLSFIYLTPLIPASRSILGPNPALMPSSTDISRYLVMLTVTRFPCLRLRGLMIV